MYLWHQPVMAFERLFVPASTSLFLISSLAITFVLAGLTTFLIERPIRAARISPLYVVGGMFVSSLIVISVTFAGDISKGFSGRYADSQVYQELQNPDQEIAQNCSYFRQSVADPEFCIFPSETFSDASPSIAVWGDSHAMALASGFISMEREYDLIHMGMNGCRIRFPDGSNEEACVAKHQAALQRILSDETVLIVVIESIYQSRPVTEEGMIALRDDVTQAVSLLLDAGREVIVVGPVPIFDRNIPGAMMRSERLGLDLLPTQTLDAHKNRPHRLGDEFLDDMQALGAIPFSTEPILCPRGECLTNINGRPLYIDDEHLTVFGARLLSIEIDKKILQLLHAENPDTRN